VNDKIYYEEKCVECSGVGWVTLNESPFSSRPHNCPCMVCKGSGKIYWTDKVKGIKNEKLPDGRYGIFTKEKGEWYYYN